jgi:hypothetical protein
MTLTATTIASALVALYIVTLVTGHTLRAKSVQKTICINELKKLGQSRPKDAKIKGTAIVCGGRYVMELFVRSTSDNACDSLSGLLAARVCHDHFEGVIIVEPEAWLSTDEGRLIEAWKQPQPRSRVAQYQSFHGPCL